MKCPYCDKGLSDSYNGRYCYFCWEELPKGEYKPRKNKPKERNPNFLAEWEKELLK